MKAILVVEDELSIRTFVSLNLRRKKYEVYEAETGEEALNLFKTNQIDIVLLDIMLSDMDGFLICQELRKLSSCVGIIMLTARTQEEDKVKGLVLGADDYVTKPFGMTELEARIISLLRRMDSFFNTKNGRLLNSGPFQIDLENNRITSSGTEISLTPTEYCLLQFLITNKNQVFSRDELLDEIWGVNYVGDRKVVDVNVRRIRTKIEKNPSDPAYLLTVWGYGYQWKD